MTVTLHWWLVPILCVLGAVVTLARTPPEDGPMDIRCLFYIFGAGVFLAIGLGFFLGHIL
jgi:hypothetical protein